MTCPYPYAYCRYDVDRQAKIATVTLSGPKEGNPAPWWAEKEMLALIDQWEQDDDVKVVILRSDKKDFCTGHDFGAYHESAGTKGSAEANRRGSNRARYVMMRETGTFLHRLMASLKPTIAEVDGQCIEWGCVVTAMCDMTIASHDAHFGCLGQTAGNAGVHYMPVYISLLGHKRARELMISGRTISGRDAALIGLANRSVPASQLRDHVLNEARRIALLPVDGIVLGKAYTETALEHMGLLSGFASNSLAWMLGLRMKFGEDEFSVLRAMREHGVGEALRQRSGRYAPYGGYGRHAELPLIIEE